MSSLRNAWVENALKYMCRRIKLTTLLSDLDQIKRLLESDSSQFNRRNYVRALFALFEADLSNLKEEIANRLVLKAEFTGEINFHEFIPLLDENVNLKSNGDVSLVPNKFPFRNIVSHVFKKYAKVFNVGVNPISDHRWESFINALKIRNRIMHPTNDGDEIITDEDLKLIFQAEDWWKQSLIKKKII